MLGVSIWGIIKADAIKIPQKPGRLHSFSGRLGDAGTVLCGEARGSAAALIAH